MATCNCDGTISQDVSDLWGSLTSFSDVFGGAAPDTIQTTACDNAVGIVRSYGFDPCDPNYAEVLSNEYQIALGQAKQVAASTPYSNPIQRTVDTTVGGQPSAPLAPGQPQPKPDNTLFLIGAIVLLAVGFILVFK
jgi:hypothetical protein